jgi:hypothetical protein
MGDGLQVFEGRVTEGDPNSVGHVITTTGGPPTNRQSIRYVTERVVGNGSFGVVYQARCLETGETVGGFAGARAQGPPHSLNAAGGSRKSQQAEGPLPSLLNHPTACSCPHPHPHAHPRLCRRWQLRRCCRISASRTGSSRSSE